MIAPRIFSFIAVAGALITFSSRAQDEVEQESADPLATELSTLAEAFVDAYNGKNIEAIIEIYTDDAESIDETIGETASGKNGIRKLYEASFRDFPERQVFLDVRSARQIADGVVLEDGVALFSGDTEEHPGTAVSYQAVLVRRDDGWKIASSRKIEEITERRSPLEELSVLVGEWIHQGEGTRMDIAIDYDAMGAFLVGTAIVESPDEGEMETEIRIGYDSFRDEIRWWSFDSLGGFSEGTWLPQTGGIWLIRTNGVTAEGETTAAVQSLEFTGDDSVLWTSTARFLNGQPLPDVEIRLVRQPPVPAIGSPELETPSAEDISANSPEQ